MNKIKILFFLVGSTLFCTTQPSYVDSCTPLMKALHNKKPLSEINRLITEGADVNAIDYEFLRWFKPVLRYALDRGTDPESVAIIRMLIKSGADVNGVTYNRIEDERLYGFMPLLTYATIYSSAEVVQMFIDAGARDTVLEEDPLRFKKTALMIAQELGKADIAKLLQVALYS